LRNYGVLKLDKWYYNEVTDASFKELINLTKWINEKYGYYPVVIGRWAVYPYAKSLGSRDIDIVFPAIGNVQTAKWKIIKQV